MARSVVGQIVTTSSFYAYGLFSWCLYLAISLFSGSFFKTDTEKDKLQFAIARDQFWNLSKSPFPGFQHYFHTLHNGLKLHYIANVPSATNGAAHRAALVVFIHGFPDSCLMWRHVLQDRNIPSESAAIVCVDLPGYGGSDSFQNYGTDVLEALTDFIVAMRERFGVDGEEQQDMRTYIVGHDWGCIVGFRLASEAPCLAERFILSNAPHPQLAFANSDRVLHSSSKIFKQFQQSPIEHWACLRKALHALGPLVYQLLLFGYIYAFHLPSFLVKYLGTGGNLAFLRGAMGVQYGEDKGKEFKVQESMASTLGPGLTELKTKTVNGDEYGRTLLKRAASPAESFWNMTSIYRDGLISKKWDKSLETIADLYNIEKTSENGSPIRRRSSFSANALYLEQYKGALRAPTTILWGEKDQACSFQICLEGIGDYLRNDSEVVLLPRSGHWTTLEHDSRKAMAKLLGEYISHDTVPSATKVVQTVYEDAKQIVKK